jgi:ribose-phosphate pyrophosphokinase
VRPVAAGSLEEARRQAALEVPEESTMSADNLRILSGNGNPKLAKDIAASLGMELSKMEVRKFPDGETRIKIEESVRGADVFVVQPTCQPAAEHLMELLIIIDALKRASADRITAVIPYYGYARQEKKLKPREPITAKLVADLLTTAGAHRLLAVDLHVQSIQGFFNLPVDHLPAGPLFIEHWMNQGVDGKSLAIVSPDVGGVGTASAFADRLNASLVIVAKRRPEVSKAQVIEVIGDLDGRKAILIDDMIDTGGSLVAATQALIQRGAAEVYACATHAVFSADAIDRLMDSPIREIVVTDTIPLPPEKQRDRIRVLSMAPKLAEAIRRVHEHESVSTIFDRYWVEEKR